MPATTNGVQLDCGHSASHAATQHINGSATHFREVLEYLNTLNTFLSQLFYSIHAYKLKYSILFYSGVFTKEVFRTIQSIQTFLSAREMRISPMYTFMLGQRPPLGDSQLEGPAGLCSPHIL